MFRTSKNDASKTVYQETKGKFDWNATPLAPVGTKAMVYIHPDNRTTFAPHCDTRYVVGRTPNHYCQLEFYIPATRGYRRSGTYRLYPQHFPMQNILEVDRTMEATTDLANKLKKSYQRQ